MSFMPKNYNPPKPSGGKYMKFEQGDNRFRILSEHCVVGYEYWTVEGKPVRTKDMPEKQPADIRLSQGREDQHWKNSIKEFWAFAVWDYADDKVKVLEITQNGVKNALHGLFQDQDWGHPNGYDIVVQRAGEGLETRYSVMAKPHKDKTEKQKTALIDTPVNVEALFDGADPFMEEAVTSVPGGPNEKISIDDIPFA